MAIDLNGEAPRLVALYLAKVLGQEMADILAHDMGMTYLLIKRDIKLGDYERIQQSLTQVHSFPELNITGTVFELADAVYGNSSELSQKLEKLTRQLNQCRKEVDDKYFAFREHMFVSIKKPEDFMSAVRGLLESGESETLRAVLEQSRKDDGKHDKDEIQKMIFNMMITRVARFKEHQEQQYSASEVESKLIEEDWIRSTLAL